MREDSYARIKCSEHAHRLLRSTPEDVSSRSWLSTRWNEEWRAAEHSRVHSFINTPDHVPVQDLPRRQWTTYNRIRTGVGRFGEAMKRWGLKSTSECECGAPNQSVQHIMDDCTMHRPPNGERGLTDLDEDTRIWLAGIYQPGNMTIDARKKKCSVYTGIFFLGIWWSGFHSSNSY